MNAEAKVGAGLSVARMTNSHFHATTHRLVKNCQRILPAIVAAAVLAIIGISVRESSVAILIGFTTLCLSALLFSNSWKPDARCIYWTGFMVSIVVSVCLFFLMELKFGAPYYKGGSDDLSYERDARATASRLDTFDYSSIRGKIVQETHNSVGYVYFVSLLYRASDVVGGYHTMLPRMFNCMLVGLLGVVTFELSQKLGLDRARSFLAGLTVSIFPLISYNASFVFRDLLIALAVAVTVNLWTAPSRKAIHGRGLLQKFVLTGLMAACVYELREEHGLVILMIACAGSLWSYNMPKSTMRCMYAVSAIVTVLVGAFLAPAMIQKRANTLAEAHERYNGYRANSTSGLSRYVFRAQGPVKYPMRIGYALVSPLPNLGSLDQFWMSCGTIPQVLFMPFFFLGCVYAFKDPKFYPMLLAFSALFTGVAFFTFQYRQMVQYLPFGVILTYIGYREGYSRRKELSSYSKVIGLILVLAYLMLKLA